MDGLEAVKTRNAAKIKVCKHMKRIICLKFGFIGDFRRRLIFDDRCIGLVAVPDDLLDMGRTDEVGR